MLAAPSAERLRAGELEAVFLPEHGMLCASLRQRGVLRKESKTCAWESRPIMGAST